MSEDIRYILYGKNAGPTDWIDPDEVFPSPDPAGSGNRYLLVWRDQATCWAFIRHHDVGEGARPRSVEKSTLDAFAAAKRMMLAIDPDEFGRVNKEEKHWRSTVEIDSDVVMPTTIPSEIDATQIMAYLALLGVAIGGPVTELDGLFVTQHMVAGGVDPGAAGSAARESFALLESALGSGGVPAAVNAGELYASILPNVLELDSMHFALGCVIHTMTREGPASGQQGGYVHALASMWGLSR